MDKKLSLIICTYMRPEPISKLLESVWTQTEIPDEVLIIDGSTDDLTADRFRESEKEEIKYYKVPPEHRGLTRQRNYGIARVNSEIDIVAFLDDDIILDPSYFQKIKEAYTVYPEALGIGGYITNEVNWEKSEREFPKDLRYFYYDGYRRIEGSRFKLRRRLGLDSDAAPGFASSFSHGRSISFLPPSGKIYEVEQLLGGVSSFKSEVLKKYKFSNYFEGYGLYEDADFTFRLSNVGKLYIQTEAKLEHHHDPGGRPNMYKYGKMVMRNGWYVWRIKHPKTSTKNTFKWHVTALLLTFVRLSNIVSGPDRKKALLESLGRLSGWCSLLLNKPELQR